MTRLSVGLFGVVMALFPDRIRTAYEQFALKNPDECVRKPSYGPAIRVEGLVLAVTSLIGGRPFAWLMNLLGVAGVFAMFFPTRSLKLSSTVTFENPEEIEWRDGFSTVIRGFGALYVGLAVGAFLERHTDT